MPPQALITINAISGSNTDLPIGVSVQLNNVNAGGEISYLWTMVSQPAGPPDVLSATTIQNPTFLPSKEGTYLISLVVNQSTMTEATDEVVAAIRFLKSRERAPGAGEEIEVGVAGWATAQNALNARVDSLVGDPGVLVGIAQSGMVRGNVMCVASVGTIKTGLPGEEELPTFTPVQAASTSDIDTLDNTLFVLEGGVDGNPSPAGGDLIRCRFAGLFTGNAGPGSINNLAYLGNGSGILGDGTTGNFPRLMGRVLTNGDPHDLMIDGSRGLNAPMLITFGSGTVSNSVVNYLYPFGSSAAAPSAAVGFTSQGAGSLCGLQVSTRVGAGGGANFTYTVVVDGVDSALSTVLSAGLHNEDFTNLVPVAALQVITIRVDHDIVGTSPTDIVATMRFYPAKMSLI